MANKLDTNHQRKQNKRIFPNVEERLKIELNLTQNFTAIVTGQGKTRVLTPI
jgi:hypothetical protein